MTNYKITSAGDYDAYVESCRLRRIIPCDRLSYERDPCTRQTEQAATEHAGVDPMQIDTSTQIVDTLPGQQQGGVVQENDPSLRVGTQFDGGRGRALQEAIALLCTITTRTFQHDDCRDEFLSGIVYGVATYASAINALAIAPGQAHAQHSFSITGWAHRLGVSPLGDHLDDPHLRNAAILAALNELHTALAGEYASIVLASWEAGRAQEDFSKITAGDVEQRKDGSCAGLS